MKKPILFLFAIALSGLSLQAQLKTVHKDNPAFIGAAQAAPAALQKIYSNLGPSTSAYDNDGWELEGPGAYGGSSYYDVIGMAFTPAANATVRQLRAAIQYDASGANQINFSLYSDSGGIPGTLLAGPVTVTNLPTFGTCCTLAIADISPGVAVTAGVQYWVVVGPPSSGTGSDFVGSWNFIPPPKANYIEGSNVDGDGWFSEGVFTSEPAGAVYGTTP